MCFLFFLVYAGVLTGVQTFAPMAARQLLDMPLALVAGCVTTYMVCSAGGTVPVPTSPARAEPRDVPVKNRFIDLNRWFKGER
jgi:hypothetical protein